MRCTVGFPETPPMPLQPCRSQCWATCLAYLMQGFGADVTVTDLLIRAGGQGCAAHDPAAELVRLHAVAGSWRDRSGRAFLLGLSPLGTLHERHPSDTRFPALLDRLSRQPLLCGAAGHTTVVTEITTFSAVPATYRRDAVTVLDPWPPTAGVRSLTEAELARPAYVLGVSLRPLPDS